MKSNSCGLFVKTVRGGKHTHVPFANLTDKELSRFEEDFPDCQISRAALEKARELGTQTEPQTRRDRTVYLENDDTELVVCQFDPDGNGGGILYCKKFNAEVPVRCYKGKENPEDPKAAGSSCRAAFKILRKRSREDGKNVDKIRFVLPNDHELAPLVNAR